MIDQSEAPEGETGPMAEPDSRTRRLWLLAFVAGMLAGALLMGSPSKADPTTPNPAIEPDLRIVRLDARPGPLDPGECGRSSRSIMPR